MREQLQTRLAELQHDLEVGERRLAQIDQERAQLRDTMLRISGAIQVIEELLAAPSSADGDIHLPSDPQPAC